MDFLNHQIELSSLPGLDEVIWKKIEPSYLKVLRFQWMIVTLVLIAVASFLIFLNPKFQTSTVMGLITGVVLVISGLYLFLIQQSFYFRAYAIRQHDILYRHGWIVKHTEACPFNRIQHCSVNSGPLERKYGLASLTLFTAASSVGDLKISGLPESTANMLREFIMKKIVPYEGADN